MDFPNGSICQRGIDGVRVIPGPVLLRKRRDQLESPQIMLRSLTGRVGDHPKLSHPFIAGLQSGSTELPRRIHCGLRPYAMQLPYITNFIRPPQRIGLSDQCAQGCGRNSCPKTGGSISSPLTSFRHFDF
jgi:hypothetical protein